MENQENTVSSQVLVCVVSKKFSEYEPAKTARDDESALIKEGKSLFSKAKVVRRGHLRSSRAEVFELRLYKPLKPDETEKVSKKKSQKVKKQD